MNRLLLRIGACGLMLHASFAATVWAQQPAPAAAEESAAPRFKPEQIDALVAPIALYPDALLVQILMASTAPLQVVQASRWIEEPAHKKLSGDALTKALEAQSWDPSVKSLVPFPQVLAMMDKNLDWTQRVGSAFEGQQAEVMNSVQRLRRQAQAHGSLQSTSQQVVRVEGQSIIIEPAQPTVVYVPSYNPTVVYGAWAYPAYQPVYLAPPPGYAVGTAFARGLAFGAGVAITAGLWNWARPSWGGGYVNVNVNRYNSINVNRTQINSNVWHAGHSNARPGGPAAQPVRAAGAPGNVNIGRQVSGPGVTARSRTRTTGPAAASPSSVARSSSVARRPPSASSQRSVSPGGMASGPDGARAQGRPAPAQAARGPGGRADRGQQQ